MKFFYHDIPCSYLTISKYAIIIRMKHTTKILTAVILCITVVLYFLYDAYFAAPRNIHVRSELIASTKIPSSMDGTSILYFTDLEYGTFMDEKRLHNLVEKINDCSADIILFGGDLFDEDVQPDDKKVETLTKAFDHLHAPLGKFAVYGDNDKKNEEVKKAVDMIYVGSEFEVLQNSSIALRARSNGSITLVGLDNCVNGNVDVNAAYSSVSHSNYVITMCHTPDTADHVPADLTDLFLAGHSHGGQAYWMFGALYTPKGAEAHLRGRSTVNEHVTLDISNGAGTTKKDIRFFADAEIVKYTLHAEKKKKSGR